LGERERQRERETESALVFERECVFERALKRVEASVEHDKRLF